MGGKRKKRDGSLIEDIVQPRAGSTKVAAVYRSASWDELTQLVWTLRSGRHSLRGC